MREAETIKIIPLGGVRENGKNMYLVEVEDEIFVLDCGLRYPENELLGIDVVIPNFNYLIENIDRVSGIFLTHGHVDAIGALPYLLEKVSVPVFGTELTIELAKINCEGYTNKISTDEFHIINEDTEIDFDFATLSFFKTTHTIPDSVGISIKTSSGNIVYTGDFRFDQSAIPMYQSDFARLTEIGTEGVLALLSDSANAENTAQAASELQIAEAVHETIRYWEGRIIVASVASNIQRIQQVLDGAEKSHRKVILTGLDADKIVKTAIKLGKLQLPSEDIFITYKDMDNYLPDELLILETGKTGEPIKSLQRMANSRHKQIKIQETDLVYITTSPSTAMETTVAQTEDMIYRAGGTVKHISEEMRVSGHGCQNDLKLMMNLLKPTYFIPIQGEYRLLAAHADLANELGIPYKNIFLTGRGDVVEYKNKRMRITGSIDADNVLIDGIGVGDIGNIVLRDRKSLSEDGIFIVVTTISRREKRIVAKPQVISKGFVYLKTSQNLIAESSEIVEDIINETLTSDEFEWAKLKQDIRDSLSRYLFKQTKRRPVILPVIMETSQKRK